MNELQDWLLHSVPFQQRWRIFFLYQGKNVGMLEADGSYFGKKLPDSLLPIVIYFAAYLNQSSDE